MKKNPKIGVIILAYNSEKTIAKCVESVLAQSHKELNCYVVDNASKDATVNIVERYTKCALFKNKRNLGYAGGNNLGIRYALADGCDAVFLLNDDAYLEPTTIQVLAHTITEDASVGSVQPVILLAQEEERINSIGNMVQYLGFGYAGGYKNLKEKIATVSTEVSYCSGAAVLYTREALEKVGLLDERFFMYHEDLDLGWRMRLAGFSNRLNKEAIAYHYYNFSKGIKKYYFMERNRLLFLIKNMSVHYLILITPMFFVMELGLFAFSIKNGYFLQRIKAWLYLFKPTTILYLLRERKKIQRMRICSDREMRQYLVARIDSQEVESRVVRFIANPMLTIYFKIIRIFI